MSKPELPTELPEDLSRTIGLASTNTSVGSTWNVGVNGMGLMISTLDQESPFEFRSYEIQSITKTKPRIDDSDEPGEQTLGEWWSRAQHSWHEGAGQEVFDSPLSSRFKFHKSKGLDVWTPGQITLLKDTYEVRNDNADDHHLIAADSALVYTYNGNIKKDPVPAVSGEGGEATVSTHSGTLINSITTDGESVYAAFSGGSLGIKKMVVSTFSSWVDVNSQTDVDVIGFVKGRLMGAKNNQLFEYDLDVTTAPEPFYTDVASTFSFTAITEAGPAIYFSGFAGDRSEIFAARLTAQDVPYASLATVGALRSVWQAPEGETIHSIKGYIGQALLIGTSRGVRVASIVTDEGDLRASELVVETDYPVVSFEPQQEFSWFTWSRYDSTSSGLGRINLGSLAYSSDLMYTSLGDIKDVVQFNDLLYFVLDEGTTSRIIGQEPDNLVPQGTLNVGEIRFGTTERKSLRYFDILTADFGKWSLSMSTNGTALAPFTTDNLIGGYSEEVISLEGTRFTTQLTLKYNELDPTQGPKMFEWRLRSEPRTAGRFRYLVPIMIYDYVVNGVNKKVGYKGMALSMLNHLKALYIADQDFQFQPLESGISISASKEFTVKMEEMRFKTYTPPNGGEGFGGIALLVLREVR